LKKKLLRWFVYVLRAVDGTLYTGIARDTAKRLGAHGSKKGSRYLRGRGPYELVHREVRFGRSSASKREAEIKSLSRQKKLELIRENHAS
jgi:putative endonuclease